jgi:hypothetical protein
VTRFYSIDDANAAMAEVEPILVGLRDERKVLIRLRDRALAGRASGTTDGETTEAERLLRLRMQGLIDQMQAGVMRLDELSVTLREIETGLIDFAALVNGRQVWLCWRLGEGPIEWWHELDTGFASRQRLIDLV